MELEVQWDGNPNIVLDIKTRVGLALPVQVMLIKFIAQEVIKSIHPVPDILRLTPLPNIACMIEYSNVFRVVFFSEI